MSRFLFVAMFVLLLSGVMLYFRPSSETLPVKGLVAIPQSSPPCPWRDATTDMTNWFPGATRYYITDQILSGKRLELQEQLGRPLTADENGLHTYIVASNATSVGTVLIRRVKAKNGALEVALGLDPYDTISHFKIQRIREPQDIVENLESLKLEDQLRGKSVTSDFHSIRTASELPDSTICASNIVEAVRALLVLHNAGQKNLPPHH